MPVSPEDPKAESPPYDVDVVLLIWNSRRFLPGLVDSLQKQRGVQLWLHVVDNGSSDDGADWVATHASPSMLIRNRTNRGFATACNQGIACGSAPYVLLLNHDATLEPDYCLRLVTALRSRAHIGSATGKVLQEGSFPTTIDSTGHVIWRSGHAFNRGAGALDEGQFDEQTEVFGVCAAAAMYKRAALIDAAVAGEIFPEAFFAYVEDVDLDFRLRWRGWTAIYEPSAIAHHARSAGGTKRIAWIEDVARRNLLLLLVREFDAAWFREHSGEIFGFLVKDACRQLARPRHLLYLPMFLRTLPTSLRARRYIHSRRTVPAQDLHRWLQPSVFTWVPARWRRESSRQDQYPKGEGVSIVIVCRNQAKWLETAILSTFNQTLPPREVIVVDDGSEDGSREVAADFRARIRYIYTTFGGRGAARNVGLASAGGEYIVFLDASQRLLPDFVERTIGVFETAKVGNLVGVYTPAVESMSTDCQARRLAFASMSLAQQCQEAVTLYRWRPVREQGFDEARPDGGEDWASWMRLRARGYSLQLLEDQLVYTENGVAATERRPDTRASA